MRHVRDDAMWHPILSRQFPCRVAMEPIRVCGSLWSHRVRPVRASNGDSTHAAGAGPCFDAARENNAAYRSHLRCGVKLDVSAAALA